MKFNFKTLCAIGSLMFGSADAYSGAFSGKSLDTTSEKGMSDVRKLETKGHFRNLKKLKIDPENLGVIIARNEGKGRRLRPGSFPKLTRLDVVGSLPWSMIEKIPGCFPKLELLILDKPSYSDEVEKTVAKHVREYEIRDVFRDVVVYDLFLPSSSSSDSESSSDYKNDVRICEVYDRCGRMVKVKLKDKKNFREGICKLFGIDCVDSESSFDSGMFKISEKKAQNEQSKEAEKVLLMLKFIEREDKDGIQSLLERDPGLFDATFGKRSIHDYAVSLEKKDIAQWIIDLEKKMRPVLAIYEIIKKEPGIYKELVTNGESVIQSIINKKRELLILAAKNSNLNLAELLIGIGADVSGASGEPLLFYAKDVETANWWIEHGANFDGKNEYGMNWLSSFFINIDLPLEKDKIPMINLALEKGVNVNEKNNSGNVALHLAAHHNYGEIAKILLNHGAEINIKNREGMTPLMRTAQHDSEKVAKLLLPKSSQDEKNEALKCAAKFGSKKIVDMLLDTEDFSEELLKNAIRLSLHINGETGPDSKKIVNIWLDTVLFSKEQLKEMLRKSIDIYEDAELGILKNSDQKPKKDTAELEIFKSSNQKPKKDTASDKWGRSDSSSDYSDSDSENSDSDSSSESSDSDSNSENGTAEKTEQSAGNVSLGTGHKSLESGATEKTKQSAGNVSSAVGHKSLESGATEKAKQSVDNISSAVGQKSSVDRLYDYIRETQNLSFSDLKFEYEIKPKGKFNCMITINGKIYKIDDLACNSKREAKNKVAEYALNKLRRVPAQDDRSSVVKLYEYCQNKSRGFSSQDIEFLYDINGDGTFDCKIRIKDELFDKHLMCRSKRAAKNEMAEYVYNELRKAETSDSANNGETKPQISDSKDSDGSDKKASSKDSNDDRNTTYVTIDKREIPVNIETVVDESIPALLDDIKKCPFEKIEKGIVWENENKTAKYSYQCAFLSLDLTPAEDALISVNIREYAQKQRGLFADDEFWPEIAQRLKYRILIYEYQEGKISRFFEYGKEFEKNGTKRICLETENRHYRKLKGAKAENSKRIINKTFAGTMFNIEDFSNSADRDSKNSDDDDWMNDDSEASDSEE